MILSIKREKAVGNQVPVGVRKRQWRDCCEREGRGGQSQPGNSVVPKASMATDNSRNEAPDAFKLGKVLAAQGTRSKRAD